MRSIRIHPECFDALAPVVPVTVPEGIPWLPPSRGSATTTVEALLGVMYEPETTSWKGFEGLVTNVVADGLSRCGSIPNWESSRFLGAWPYGEWSVHDETLARTMVRRGKPAHSFSLPEILAGGNSTRFEMEAFYTGYIMETTSWFDYISILALLVHAFIALVHTILVLWRGKTSGTWDTILEMLALSHMSPPPSRPGILACASAGIRSFKTVRLVASVEVARDTSDSGPGQELQLKVQEGYRRRDPELELVVGQVYGSAPKEQAYYRARRTI